MEEPQPGREDGALQRPIDDLQRQMDALREQVIHNRADIDAHQVRADASDVRADASEARADASEARADIDREMIAALQSDGLVSQRHAANVQEALRTSRRIGAAVGIVMANRALSEEADFEVLRRASQTANVKLRLVAEEVIYSGDVSGLPNA
jgi:hypothetical protein